MKKLGLIGYPLSHSFSKKYYDAKIQRLQLEGIDYQLYPLESIADFPKLLAEEPQLMGVNVTIPYKVAVMPYVQQLSPEATAINAVNCICIERQEGHAPRLTGYNTDVYGFSRSLEPLLRPWHRNALVLGCGGAAKAVTYTLNRLGIAAISVSRTPQEGQYGYGQLDAAMMEQHTLIINTTPLGTYPAVEGCPDIPYHLLSERHLLYDLVYNPAETEFLKRGRKQGAILKNGLEMLELQAERNWEIWNTSGK